MEKGRIILTITVAVITCGMIFTGGGLMVIYSGETSDSKTYNQVCVEQFNYTCGFCGESSGEYYSCKNNLLVKSNPPNKTYLIIAMCLFFLNPGVLLVLLFLPFFIATNSSKLVKSKYHSQKTELTNVVS